MDEADGQLHTLSVLEQLREASKGLWGASSEAYFRVVARYPPQPPLSGRDVGPDGSACSVDDCGVGERCGRTCCNGCGDCELSGAAVYAEEWDTGDQAASERVRAQSAISV